MFQAIELATGKVRWEWDDDGPGYAAPVLMRFGETRQIVAVSYSSVVSFDPLNGKELWRVPFTVGEGLAIPTPTQVNDRVIVGGHQTAATAIQVDRIEDDWMASIIWESNKTEMYMSSPIVIGKAVYGYSDRKKGQFFCLNPKDGSLNWQSPGRTGENALLLGCADSILATTTEGKLIVFKATAEKFESLAEYTISGDAVWCPVVPLVRNEFLIKDKSTLTRWSVD